MRAELDLDNGTLVHPTTRVDTVMICRAEA